MRGCLSPQAGFVPPDVPDARRSAGLPTPFRSALHQKQQRVGEVAPAGRHVRRTARHIGAPRGHVVQAEPQRWYAYFARHRVRADIDRSHRAVKAIVGKLNSGREGCQPSLTNPAQPSRAAADLADAARHFYGHIDGVAVLVRRVHMEP